MTNRKKHKTKLILPCCLVVLLGFVLLYAGGLYKIEVMVQEIVVLEEEVDQINTKGSEIRKQTSILKEILPSQEPLGQYFINRDNIVEFTDYLEEISEKAGVTSKHTTSQMANSLNFTLLFDGEFGDCMYFIALIESLPYSLIVENVFVEQIGQEELWSGGMSVNFPGSGTD